MKKFVFLIILILITFGASGCGGKRTLLILNWGEYINDEVVELFEEKYNVDVKISIADSNELFYSKIKSGTTAFDLVVPSEYMVEKMVQKNLLQKLDFSKLTNYDPINNPFMPGVLGIQSDMFRGNEEYIVPYFWGTFGLMYNKNKENLEKAVTNYGWKAYFEKELLPVGTKIGMYKVPRFAYAATMFYNNLSPNSESNEALEIARTTLESRKFNAWETDNLKKAIAANNLDLAFVYTGDFLDMLYTKLDSGLSLEEISFDIYVPDETIAFMDSFVIPKNARHVDLAHQFMDFLLDPEIAYLNASVVGYCTPLLKSYEKIINYEGDDEWLNSWAYANKNYYPLPKPTDVKQYKGTPLSNLSRDYLNQINILVNNIKVG